jgi:hypothetical protein
MQKILQNNTVALFVVIWQILSNHGLIRFIFYLYLMLHACV